MSTNVTDSLIAFLQERDAKGRATYGGPLQTHNGRNSVHDLMEELIDAMQYAWQWELERADLRAELTKARARIAELEAQNP